MKRSNRDLELMIRNDLTGSGKVLNFFLYECLGITMGSAKDDILNAIIKTAYQDATRRVLSITNADIKALKKDAAMELIKESLDDLIGNDELDFDDWHRDLCKKLCDCYKDCPFNPGRSFTMGIAQKLVNMTLKYIYLLCCLYEDGFEGDFEDSEFAEAFLDVCFTHSKKFHIPLDSYMLKAIAASPDQPLRKDGNEGDICGLGIDGKAYHINAWSKIDNYDDYIQYQLAVRESKIFKNKRFLSYGPIDWEISAWIQQSMNEKM